jgi:lycopene cyclase domain-containing protein
VEYTYATLAVMAGCLGAACWQGAVRERAFWLALAAFGLVTLAVDVVLTAIPVYAYAERFRSGLDVHRMPLEDLGYGLALACLSIVLWRAFGDRA